MNGEDCVPRGCGTGTRNGHMEFQVSEDRVPLDLGALSREVGEHLDRLGADRSDWVRVASRWAKVLPRSSVR